MCKQALLEAYRGYYGDDKSFPNLTDSELRSIIRNASPKARLAVYLEWNGIINFTETIWSISQGEGA